jgi:hypothetical protein
MDWFGGVWERDNVWIMKVFGNRNNNIVIAAAKDILEPGYSVARIPLHFEACELSMELTKAV